MSDTSDSLQKQRRKFMALLAAAGASPLVAAGCARSGGKEEQERNRNALLWAVAWKQTAAEYRALCHQAYNLARLRLDLALAKHSGDGKPLAVITDMDDTILHADSYWGHLIELGKEFFDDAIWDKWLPKNLHTVVPGALEFFDYCAEKAVDVFYVTSRNQGDRTYEYALAQLRQSGFPYADEKHLTVYRDSSDKSPAREAIAQTHDIVLLLGDNLNDYKRDYYVNGVDERIAVMERDRADFGDIFILLPNPTDGHWVRAIFGESEPVPSNAAYKALFDAATRRAWDGN